VAGEQEESIKEDAVQLNRSASSLVISQTRPPELGSRPRPVEASKFQPATTVAPNTTAAQVSFARLIMLALLPCQ
jgi:hypothetical protein